MNDRWQFSPRLYLMLANASVELSRREYRLLGAPSGRRRRMMVWLYARADAALRCAKYDVLWRIEDAVNALLGRTWA